MKFIVYVAVLLVTAAGLALGLDLLTAPPKKLEANNGKAATEAVRQIPIERATAKDSGDPNNTLTPIYPAAPGQNLPIKDTPVLEAAKPAAAPAAPQTSGSAPARADAAPSASLAPVSAPAAASAGACNIAACEAAYRSFRASDCSYQPFEGERKFCDAGQIGADQAAVTPSSPSAASTPKPNALQDPRERVDASQDRKSQDQRAMEAAIQAVRRMPPPSSMEHDPREVVVEEPMVRERYLPRGRWIIEQR